MYMRQHLNAKIWTRGFTPLGLHTQPAIKEVYFNMCNLDAEKPLPSSLLITSISIIRLVMFQYIANIKTSAKPFSDLIKSYNIKRSNLSDKKIPPLINPLQIHPTGWQVRCCNTTVISQMDIIHNFSHNKFSECKQIAQAINFQIYTTNSQIENLQNFYCIMIFKNTIS